MKKAWAVIRSLIIAIVVVEIIVRFMGHVPYTYGVFHIKSEPQHCFLADSITGFRLHEGEFNVTLNDSLDWVCTIDENGRRILPKVASDARDLLLIGDSYSFGWGFDDSLAYAYRLQNALPQFDIANHTCPGHGTIQAWQQISGLHTFPEYVIVNYCSFHDERNALTPFWRHNLDLGFGQAAPEVHDSYKTARFPYAQIDGDTLSYHHCQWEDLYFEWPGRSFLAMMNYFQNAYEAQGRKALQPELVTQRLLEQINELCLEKGSKLIVAGITKDPVTSNLMSYCDSLDITTCYMGIDLHNPIYHNAPWDTHPNARAAAHFAMKMEAEIARLEKAHHRAH